MSNRNRLQILLTSVTIAALLVVTLASAAVRHANDVRSLVSDGSMPSESTDGNLRNGWGLVASPTGPWSVVGNATSIASFYDSNGVTQQQPIQVPGSPTGIAYNGGASFVISDGTSSGAAQLLFASKDGTISGWSPVVPQPGPSTQAFVAVNNSATGAVYTGLTLASTITGDRLYAADFHNAKVDVFDGSFTPVSVPGAFVDPKLPSGYAPFGIQSLMGRIFVTYAKQGASGTEPLVGSSLGVVDVYDTQGAFLARVAAHGQLDAPWGVAAAPVSFGDVGGDLLISNFGSGEVVAYRMSSDLMSFSYGGLLRDANNKPIVIEGLRGIGFGNGQTAGPLDTLFFTSGPNNQQAGLFGRIDVAAQ